MSTVFHTSRFGDIEVGEDRILEFPTGIIGFPHMKRYVLLDHDRNMPFQWLQSLDHESLAFIVMDPNLFKPDYRVVLGPPDMAELGANSSEELLLLVILTVPTSDPSRITANLRGPIVVNRDTRKGKQMVLREELPTRFSIFPGGTGHSASPPESEPVGAVNP